MIIIKTIRSTDNTFAQDISYYRLWCSHHQYNAHTWFWLVLQGPVFQSDQGFPDTIKTRIYDWLNTNKSTAWENSYHWFPAKRCLTNERRNSILMTCHCPDLGSASDWLNQISHTALSIRSTTQIWVVMHLSMEFLSLFLFCRETSGSVAKCWLFSQANKSSEK